MNRYSNDEPPDYDFFTSIMSAYTPKGNPKYNAIYLKLTAKTMNITASSIYCSNIKDTAQRTKPCIT